MTGKWVTPRNQFGLALLAASLTSVGLFLFGAWRNHSWEYGFFIWNLILAWLPLLFAAQLTRVLRRKLWSSWEALSFTLLWLIFLPNSFYMVSDLVHLQEIARVNVLYDAIMFASFTFTGFALGFGSLYLVHLQLSQRISTINTHVLMGLTLLACSIGIFAGRDLRWNSWDILTNPGGLLFDVSERLSHLSDYPTMVSAILAIFLLLATVYALLWSASRLLLAANHNQNT